MKLAWGSQLGLSILLNNNQYFTILSYYEIDQIPKSILQTQSQLHTLRLYHLRRKPDTDTALVYIRTFSATAHINFIFSVLNYLCSSDALMYVEIRPICVIHLMWYYISSEYIKTMSFAIFITRFCSCTLSLRFRVCKTKANGTQVSLDARSHNDVKETLTIRTFCLWGEIIQQVADVFQKHWPQVFPRKSFCVKQLSII